MKLIDRRKFMQGAAGGALALAGGGMPLGLPGTARAQDAWPTRPIKFVVPLAAGGGLDFIARLTGEYISRHIGQQVVVENRTGGGGTIAIDSVIKSPPDGYTLLLVNDNVASAPHVLGLPSDYTKSLEPVCLLALQPLVFAVHPSLGVNSMAELIKSAKERPGQGCATSGVGSNQHVLLEWLIQTNGVQMQHVPYRGAGQAINDLIAGHVKIGCLGPTAVMPHAKAGTLKILAQTGATRSPALPDVPTLPESGFKDIVLSSWYAAFAPIGTPPAIIKRLNAEMDKAMGDPASRANMIKSVNEAVGGPPERLAKLMTEDSAKYGRLVKELKISTK